MKKIFTLVMLSILTVINASAAEEVLWTCSEDKVTLEWGTPWNPGELTTPLFTKDQFASFENGQKFYFYFETVDGDYQTVRFARWNGQENSLGIADYSPAYDQYTPARIELEITTTVKTNVAGESDDTGGFTVCGHNVKLVRVTKEVAAPADINPTLLWQGEIAVDGWGSSSLNWTWAINETELTPFVNTITGPCNLYVLIDGGTSPVVRLAGAWGDWSATGYPINTKDYDVDGENIVKIPVTQDFVTKAFEEHGGFAIWGNGGYTIKAIATTKETLLNKIHTDANGYATYSSNNTLALNNLPAGLEAYTATLAGTTLSFTQKEVAVGAETGLLFKGEANTDYYIPAKTDATAAVDNALKAFVAGGALASTVSEYIFVMKKATYAGTLTFQKLSITGVTMPANKAYVQVAASAFPSAHALSISFGEGGVTGISEATLLNINEVIKNNNVYDLSGRRVAKPTKGLYIVNGKKVVIK